MAAFDSQDFDAVVRRSFLYVAILLQDGPTVIDCRFS